MALVGVERVEVLPDGHDLGAVPDLVAHAEEDVLDLAADLRQQVQPAARDRRAGDRHVDAAVGGRAAGGELELLLALRRPRSSRRVRIAVQEHAALAVADAAQRLRELGLAAEVADARVLERAVGDRAQRLLFVRGPVHRGETIQVSSFASSGFQVRPRCGWRNALRSVPGCAPGPAKPLRACGVHR